ncbi:hypothetical protein CAter282_0309 [Collimonas arenae]|uniref:Uncharacterized protein n=1 Tax=Collimonas arenae TaxID=279058 RepID=A0A127PKJ0_9BURK|nr:hypothetical protein CAter10_0326 [Collimonas arenae]AMP08127.1 hypothetical protein CAter282_0309 [Collimonas arenae]
MGWICIGFIDAGPGNQRPLGGVQQVVHKVKHQASNRLAPNADGVPEQVL